jgi:hypothetical protein
MFRFAKWAVRGGLALGYARSPLSPRFHHVASVLYLAGGLAFRFAWVEAGRQSATDHEAVARTARGRDTAAADAAPDGSGTGPRSASVQRRPLRALDAPGRLWTETVRRVSLGVEGVLRSSRG